VIWWLCPLGESEHYAYFVRARLSARASASWEYASWKDRRNEAEQVLVAAGISCECGSNVACDDILSQDYYAELAHAVCGRSGASEVALITKHRVPRV
jgi:hypothetical protein